MPPLSRRKEMLQALTYVATGASVLLGTLHMDLYIAVTTATVSLLTGILEYQKLVEVNVETFLADKGYVENDIIVAALQAPPGVHTCIDYLMAATDYMAFLQLMSDFNQLSDAVES